MLAPTGDEGFRAAAESADVELILVDPHLHPGRLAADRHAGQPPGRRADGGHPDRTSSGRTTSAIALHDLLRRASRASGSWCTPTDAGAAGAAARRAGRRRPPTAERAGYAREAAALLAQIAAGRAARSSRPDRRRAGADGRPEHAADRPAASAALGDVPDARRPARPGRRRCSTRRSPPPLRLARRRRSSPRSIQRFGPLVTADQEARLLAAFDQETDPALRTALAAVIGALRPQAVPDRPPGCNVTARPRPPAAAPSPSATPSGAEASPPPAAAQP